MTISYNWLSEYLPVKLAPERLSEILTSIGLEVESVENYESVKGGLKGLIIGEVTACMQHPNADKLKLTQVNTGTGGPLQIVCGASNVEVGQKVVVAPVGTTIYPFHGEPVTMKVAKIRNVESFGMICAEDEIGLSDNHAGILVLPAETPVGLTAEAYFQPYEDVIFEIGLTPNRMDAMSHLGVARDVCAYLSHHDNTPVKALTPLGGLFMPDNNTSPIAVSIENRKGCRRYAGVSIRGVTIAASPAWMQNKLKAIGLRPINNIVDITNYILHETGQPLHAFDADSITGGQVIVKNLPGGTPFITLDEKERKLSAEDLMICNDKEPLCIAGVFGGLYSGVQAATSNIFLESAWFNPFDIRKTSFRHNLRTDAASRFEKGVDISNAVNVLKRAAYLVREIAGGKIVSDIVDVYPDPQPKTEVTLTYGYLEKLTGKKYAPEAVREILEGLGFETAAESAESITVKVPYSKPDISLPADIVEEVLRIDGFDNVAIPSAITITPSVKSNMNDTYKEKLSGYLTGAGFGEVMTNSITNSSFFSGAVLAGTVKMMNSLSAELDVMRPSMLQTGLQAIAHNINRRNTDLRFYEFGKTYETKGPGKYSENDHLCLYITGNLAEGSWKAKPVKADFYYLKGVAARILELMGMKADAFTKSVHDDFDYSLQLAHAEDTLVQLGQVSAKLLERFDIKQDVLFADFNWNALLNGTGIKIRFSELPKQLPVQRDLSIVVPRSTQYDAIRKTVDKINLTKLQSVKLFDVFESDKLGADKKSMAVSFSFLDEQKTLNDKEIDGMMSRIMSSFEQELKAEIRK